MVLVIAMGEYGWLRAFTQDKKKLELIARFPPLRKTTNAQLWWAIVLSLPVVYWLRRFTKSSIFSLMLSVLLSALCIVTLARVAILEWLESDPPQGYFYLIPSSASSLTLAHT